MESSLEQQENGPSLVKKTLAEVEGIKVLHPEKQAILPSEGIHLEIAGDKDGPWRKQDIRQLLKEAFFALPTAKVLAEGRYTDEFWANIHLNSHPGFDQGWNVFGRNPNSDEGWARPISFKETSESSLSQEQEKKLKDTFLKYLPLWGKALSEVTLFKDGVKAFDNQSSEFQKLREDSKDLPIWANDKWELVIVGSPHLSGLHLVVHPKEQVLRAWQDPEAFLEAAAILLGAQRLLQENGLPFYNPEVHFSGNWAKDLLPQEKGGKLNLANEDKKQEKRAHRVGGEKEWETSMHGHLYATRDPKIFVSLPSRPKTEVPEQWAGIAPLSDVETQKVEDLINNNLTTWLEENAAGKL